MILFIIFGIQINLYYETIFTFFLITLTATAQTSVITNVNGPQGFLIDGSTMYACEQLSNRIVTVDLTATLPITPTTYVLESFQRPASIAIHNGLMYVTSTTDDKVSRFDYTQSNPAVTDIGTGLDGASPSILIGDELFVGLVNANKIIKFDLTQANPTPIDVVVTGIDRPISFALYNNELYFSQYDDHKISKIDYTLASPTVIDVLSNATYAYGLEFYGNSMYYIKNDTKLIKVENFNTASPIIAEVATMAGQPSILKINGTDLYVSKSTGNEIIKFDLLTLSNPNFNNFDTSVIVFPNPSSNQIRLKGYKQTSLYKLIDITGRIIQEGTVVNESPILINSLANGTYFLRLNTSNSTIKFVKK